MARKQAARRRRMRASIQQQLEEQRHRLLGADAVVICLQRAMDSLSGRPDELRVMDALQVVSDIINDAVAALRVAKDGAGIP
jgi:hypothetical protein